jgi:hypothetical protein
MALMLAATVHAANYYVTESGSGAKNGADWSNAYQGLPDNLVRSSTYYIAGGTYGSHTFNPLSGTSYVYLVKATASAHGTDTGWQSSYGTNQAVFSSSSAVFVIHMKYLSIDGVVGSGTSGYGIKLSTTGTGQGSGATIYSYSNAPDYLILRHLELEAPEPNGNLANFNIDSQVWPGAKGELISYCYIHGGLVAVLFTGSDAVIEHSYLQNNGGQEHSEMIDAANVQNLTIRYNTFENMVSTSNGHGTTYIEPQVNGGSTPNGIYIYGNIFKATRSNEATSNPSVFSSTSGELVLNVFIYNNVIYGLHGSPPSVGMADTGVRGDNPGSTITVQNNLWQANSYNPGFQAVQVHDHNILNTGEAGFVNAADGDFHLTAATKNGIALPSPFNIDPDGKIRGADGVWDIGAYEYNANTPCTPSCTGKSCGSDGCGSSCGNCDAAYACDINGQCVSGACVPQAEICENGIDEDCDGLDLVCAGNLIANGDFERGFTSGIGNGWYIQSDGSISYSASSDSGYQGKAQKIQVTQPGSWGLFVYQTPAFDLGKSYNWSFWYKTDTEVFADISDAQANSMIVQKALTSTSGQWKQASIQFTYTDQTADQLRFSIETVGKFWIDDVVLIESCAAADVDCDGCIEQNELLQNIQQWKTGTISLAQLMEAIRQWKEGC